MELTEEDREKKLAAGREKLAAFRKKRARRRTQWDGGEGDKTGSTQHQSNGSPEAALSVLSATSDSNSVTGESDQFSLTSGDEWSAEESELHSSVYYQTKLASATQRIAELEEALEGKQLALDRMVMEMQSYANTMSNKYEDDSGYLKGGCELRGSVTELKEALIQRDKIICQLTSHLQWKISQGSDLVYTDTPDYMQETQLLSQEVSVLQHQLSKAGETLRNQEAMCQASVQALQEAKEQILNLRVKITEKNDLLHHLSQNLASNSADLLTLKAHECELMSHVKELQEQAVREAEARQMMSDTAQADANRVCLLEQELDVLTNQQDETFREMAELQEQLRKAEALCACLKEENKEALEKIACLERELDKLVDEDRAFARLSDLEDKVQEQPAIIQTIQDHDLEYNDTSERVMELEREISDLSRDHRIYIDHLNQRNAELEMLLAENIIQSTGDMPDLKNKINSQQNEILALTSQLQAAEAENAFHKVQVVELQEQLEELQMKYTEEQGKHAKTVGGCEKEIHLLQAENSQYKIKIISLEEEILTLKQELSTSIITMAENTGPEKWDAVKSGDRTNDSLELVGIEAEHLAMLQKSYSDLETQFATLLQQNAQLQMDLSNFQDLKLKHEQQESTIRDLLSQVDHLQDTIEDWTLQVQEKNYQVENLQSQLIATVKEKEELVQQMRQQSEIVEKQTYSSDTHVRKLESCIGSLNSELSNFKEALKESETANIELQDKFDAVRAELEAAKNQSIASECKMAQLKSEWETEKDQLLKDLQQKADELQTATLEKVNITAAAEDARVQQQQALRILELQHAEILQQNQYLLSERDQLVVSHGDEIARLEENLKQKTEELVNLSSSKNHIVLELAAVLDKQTKVQQELEMKLQELMQAELTKKQLSEQLSCAKEEIARERSKFSEQLEQKTQELLLVTVENEKLAKDKELQDLKQQLDHKSEELSSVIYEKEKISHELAALWQIQSTNMARLEEKTENLSQTASTEEKVTADWESIQSELNNQLLMGHKQLEDNMPACSEVLSAQRDVVPHPSTIKLDADSESKDSQEQLEQRDQQIQILVTENQRLHEHSNSSQSVAANNWHLHTVLKQKEAELSILMSEWEAMEMHSLSRESVLSKSLQAVHQILKEKEALSNHQKVILQQLETSAETHQETVYKLHWELDKITQQLAIAEQDKYDILQNKQKEIEAIESKMNQIVQDLISAREEIDSRTVSLADQAEMFRAKEEEMVAENNSLNHQLEEVKNEAQRVAEQTRAEQESARVEIDNIRSKLLTKDVELQALKEDLCHQKNMFESQSASVVNLNKEKDELTLQISELEKEAAEIQNEYHTQCHALHAETGELKLELEQKSSKFEQEKQQLVENCILLKEQLESVTNESEQLQRDLAIKSKELETMAMDLDSLLHQKNTLQHEFSAELEGLHAKVACKDAEILGLNVQLKDATEQLKQQMAVAQEEVATIQGEIDQKNIVVVTLQEELEEAKLQLEQTKEEKELLKNNFDCCMEDMTQRSAEQETIIKQLQSRLAEASHNVDRDQGQLREMYESQLSDLEDRLAITTAEVHHLENASTSFDTEKMKLKESYSSQIAELEVSLQSTELEQLRLKEQMNKMIEAHEKEILETKHSFEIQLATVEENCQSLEKALAKQDSLMVEASNKFEQEKTEREKNFEVQMSDLYEMARMHETEVGRVKRQMDEIRRDHQKEKQDLQQALETHIFELENKCSIATCELDRMRSSLWTMEGDFSTERNSLQQKISELEDICLSREKQILELQDKLARMNSQSEENSSSLMETHQSEMHHLEEVNDHMAEDIRQLQEQLKAMQDTHRHEIEALKYQHCQEASILQERCRQIETHSQVLQFHLGSLSSQPAGVELPSVVSNRDNLHVDITVPEDDVDAFQNTLTEREKEISQLHSKVSILTWENDRKDTEIKNLSQDIQNEKEKYEELQLLCTGLEHQNKQLLSDIQDRKDFGELTYEGGRDSPDGGTLTAECECKTLVAESEHQNPDNFQLQNGDHSICAPGPKELVHTPDSVCFSPERFEPEPDYPKYLDLATMTRKSSDYFVEEADTNAVGRPGGRPRIRSVSANMFVAEGFELDMQSLPFTSSDYHKNLIRSEISEVMNQKERNIEAEATPSNAGCFEPEEENIQLQSVDFDAQDTEEASFQLESLPDMPRSEYSSFLVPDQSFLPFSLNACPSAPMLGKKLSKCVDSYTQTDGSPDDSFKILASNACSNMESKNNELNTSGDKAIKNEQIHVESNLQTAELMETAAKETIEKELNRRLESMRDDLEEKWVQKMRSQEVELRHQHDLERIEYQTQLEQQCHQQVEALKYENHIAFIKAVRQMKKSLTQKKKHPKHTAEYEGKQPEKGLSEDWTDASARTASQAADENLVEQLHKENQELAEVRDVLLEQIAISHTQGLRQTMQHELQSIVSECSKRLPSLSLKSMPSTDEEAEATSDSTHTVSGAVSRHGRVAERIVSILHRGEIKQQMAAVFKELLSQQPRSTNSEESKTAFADDNDPGPVFEGESEPNSAQELFLEELEEMSQQSGQDLPLEWELTSATVSQAGATTGDFDRDQMGTGSVWEVFDGRCLRQDCLELESIKQKHEAEMASLHQQLEEYRQISEKNHVQLQEQYLQAVESLRNGLAQAQQKELDAVVEQLQELHERQLKQLQAQQQHDLELEVIAVRVAVEQVQNARVHLIQEEHEKHLQHLKKEHKDQLNALHAEVSNLQAGDRLLPLTASEELTRRYQQLIQKITKSLENQMLTLKHEDCVTKKAEKKDQAEESGSPDGIITAQQAEAIQEALQAQQEEVLYLRSELLAEYEHLLQQRSAEATLQTQDILRLQEEMAALQQQYQKQINEFQTRLSNINEQKGMQGTEELQQDLELENVKATYEQRITDLEDSFTRQIAALQQTALNVPDDAIDCLTSQLAALDSTQHDSPLTSQRLVFVKDYVHKSTFIDGTCKVDADTTSSSWGLYGHEGSRLQELIKAVEEKNAQIVELEKHLYQERQNTEYFIEKLSKLEAELEEQKQMAENVATILEERECQLQKAHQKAAESEKLLRELTEKEGSLKKETHEDGLYGMQESDVGDSGFAASPSSMEEEVHKLKVALDQATISLRAVEQRECKLREQLEEIEHQHQDALEAVRQELEHEAQVERDSLQSEFQVQLEVELRRQAAELQRQFVEQTARTLGITGESCSATSAQEEESAPSSTALETSAPPHFQAEETVQEAVFTHEACLNSHVAGSGRMSGEIPLSGTITEQIITDVSQTLVGVDIDSLKEELKSDFDKQVEKLKQLFDAEKTQMSNTYLEQIERLQNQLLETEEKYNRLQEVIEEHEGAGVEQLLKDRYDMELELAKSLMQKEFDDTLASEKKKFVERHRQLMDGFMAEQEAEAEKIKEQHQQDLNKLRSSLTVKYATIIADLHGMIQEQRQELSVLDDECQEVSSEKELTKSKEEEKETNVKDDECAESEDSDDLITSELHSLRLDLTELCGLVVRLKTKQQKAVGELRLQHEARLSELEAEHQDQLEAAALDTDVLKSELDCALAELESLQQTSQQTTQLKTEKMLSTEPPTLNESSREALQSVSEISFALLPQFERASQSGKDGNQTPDIHSSLEYEETDEEGSLHSFSSLLGKTRSFANGVKTPLPSPEPEQRIKQLKAEIEQLTQELEQKQASILTDTTVSASSSSPPAEAAVRTGRSKESESLIAMLQSDLDRISAERDTIQQTNNRLLQLLSDSIHTYVEVEDSINRRLQSIVSASGPRPHSPCPLPLESRDNLLASGGTGVVASSNNVISKGAGIMSSPRSERSWQPGEADSSFTLEETSILSIATDEGLDVSQRLTDSIFTGPDIGAEGEEIVADARGRLQSAVSHLLDLIGQTTQQLMEAKKTQADLLESLAARSNDSNIMAARIQDLEEQFRQEVSAKEYFSLELHKAEGLIKGYSSEREAMEEQIQLLEEQKEVLARSLETTRSQLQDFQDAAGELEARRQDVERHQILLQQNAGQEAQESSMTGGDATKSEEQALLVEVNVVKQEKREQTLQLQHRLDQTQQCLQDREATLEEMERVFQRQREEMREQLEDLRLQLENTERQLKSNKQFLDEQMNERELEREEFQREIEKLRLQVQDKDKQEGSHVSLHREIQDLTEHLHVRVEREAVMHQRMQELQHTLQDRDLSAQDLRIWIATLEKELDQRGDVEQQLKDRIQKLEQQLSQEDGDVQSVRSSSPMATPRPGSPDTLSLSLRQPTTQQAISCVSLEEELRKSRQAEEELTHEKEALKNTVQQQLLQISALRNQLDDLRHWRGPPEPSTTTSTAADLRDELESEREEVQKKEEKIIELKSTQENLEKQLAIKQRELEQLTKHLEEMQHKFVSVDHIVELERERDSLKTRVGELSAAHAFPPALLEEKNAEIDELRLQLNKTEAQLKEKEELVSDLQDTMLSLQRGETCLDVSLPFNEPVSLNASFTERTTLAQELDQTVSERETEVAELTTQVDRLTHEMMHVKEQLQEAVTEKAALIAELHQKEEDLSQLQEEKVQKQEAMVEKDSRLEQLMVQVKSLQTEITSLTAFQMELQKDYDTVQNMLEEKEQEIESLTREYLETRSQPDGSDVADSLKEEVKSLSAILAEKEVELQKEKKLHAEAQRELKELQVTGHDHTDHPPDDALRSLEEQISKLKTEVHHLEESVKDKEELIRNLEEEKSSETASHEKESAAIRVHLTDALNEQTTKVTQLEIQLADKERSLQLAECIRDQVLQAKEKEATILHETLQSKTEIIEKLEREVMSLQHQITEKDLCITDLKGKSQELQDHVKEMSHLEEQLHKLSSVPKNAATDEGKALQNELAQASEKLITLTQQLTETQIHLEQTSSQLAEKGDHIQQLQAEIQTLQLQAHQHAEDKELNVTSESFSYLKTQESSDDGELHDDGLRDFLAKAQQIQMTMNESLSASLPMSSEMSRLSRWDSEPGLSSTYPTELVSLTYGTETWMRRQQREMAAKNRELALLREELEGWLRRKGTSLDSTISASTLLKLREKESLIISLKRELVETKALLVAAEKRAAETSENFFSMELTPQTKQQIAHLRSELRLAKAALTALQKHSQRDGLTSDVDKEASHEEQDRSQKLEAEHHLHKSSAIVSTKDFLQKVQELREEITLEHQKHIQDIQEAARQDAEMKMTEMQVRHDHEVQQLRSHHERRLEQALTHQQQELEKQHKTELNSLRVQHQQEIDRLRSEELASLTDGSVVSRLRADVGDTQQMDEHLIGSFVLRADGSSQDDLSTAETSSIMSGSEEALPSRLQALLTRLRQAGDHILSISELNFLLQHLTPHGEVSCQTLQEAFEGEKSSLVKTINALKELLSQADRVGSGLQDTMGDWRSELLHALVEVYQHERLALEAELYTLRLQHSSTSTEDALKHFDNRLREQEQLHQSGLNAMLRAERQSLLAELDDLHARVVRQRTEQQEQQLHLSEALAKMEEQASNKEWKLQREVQVLEYKLQQEKVIEDDLRKGLEAERRHTTDLSAELSRSKAALTSLQSELQTTQIQLSRTKDALEREQHRFTSVTGEWSTCLDALEEERQKNNRLAEMLETLKRQQHNLETELGRKEAIYKERESTESKIIKELRAELASQREQLRKTSESAEKERRERQQAQTAANEAEQTSFTLRQEVDKVQHQTKKVLEGESIKLQELQNMLKQEQHHVTELQESLEDRDSIIARLTREVSKSEDLQVQVQQLQRSLSSTELHLETERQKVRDLTNLLDKEHEERGSVLQRESELTKQMRSELSTLKAETSDVRHQLELETSRAEGFHLELERAQSELRAVTQHSGATERQLQAEQTVTWSKLRAAQHEKDELQIKVHQLELELERMQEKLQDLELELDRSHQRELEARHDIERYKLYPAVSPRMAFSDCQAESSDTQMQARLSSFLRQLQAIGDHLQVLVVRQRNHNSATCSDDNSGETSGNKDSCSVESLLQELQVLQGKMSERDQLDGGDFNQIVEMEQLKMRVTTLIKEKKELQHRLDLLENEDNIRTPKASGTNMTASTSTRQRKQQPVAIPQYLSDAPSDDEATYERTIWASERLNLQMALDSAEHEIDRLKKELRHFRGRYTEGFVMEADRDKMQRLYGKYLRAESFRKALVYQKKYLLLLLGGYQDSEQETLAIIATMGGQPSSTLDLAYRRGHRRLYTIFRSAARTVVAIFRMKYLVRKWKRATRVGSPIVTGRVNQQYGYVATAQSFTQPNFVDHPDDHCSTPSATSLYVHTLTRGSSNGNTMSLHSNNPISCLTDDGGASGDYGRVRFNTPPTKEFTHPLRSSSSHLSTSARRPLLHVLNPSENARSSVTTDSGVLMGAISGDAPHTFGGGGDDFIQRLENLQSRLSSQNGSTPKRPAWR